MIGMQRRLLFVGITVCLYLQLADTQQQQQACESENSRIQSQNTVYQCINGTFRSVGCLTDNGTYLEDGKTLTTESYLMQCQKIDTINDLMKIVPIGCIKNGKILAPTQTFVENSVWFTCVFQNDQLGVVLKLSGCVGPDNEKVTTNGTLTKGNYVFKCEMNNNDQQPELPELRPTGCTYEKNDYGFGDRIKVGQFWYQCEQIGQNGIHLRLKGCLDEDGLIYAGEIFHSKGFLLKCEQTSTGLRRVGLGCLEVTNRSAIVEHLINDTWIESKSNSKARYVVKCTQDENKILLKTPIRCYFPGSEPESDGMTLDPGCISKRSTDGAMLRCTRTETGGLKALVVDNAGPEQQAKAILDGLKFC